MKYKLYFVLASYFRFFASLVLKRWQPKIVVVTGSAGKSTSLYLIANLLRKKFKVKKSTKANSAFGVPLDILGIHFVNYSKREWFNAFVLSPVRAFKSMVFPPAEAFYVVELDVDRPGEMEFFAQFIHPETVFWVSSYATHTTNFAPLVAAGVYKTAEEAVAAEFAKILDVTKKTGTAILNIDSSYIKAACGKRAIKTVLIGKDSTSYSIQDWKIYRKRTEFTLLINKKSKTLSIPYILPRTMGYTLVALFAIATLYELTESDVFSVLEEFTVLPGRTSIFDGVHDSALIDSTYNSNFYATSSLLKVLRDYPGKRKIAVLGDMRELGAESEREHRRLAQAIVEEKVDQVVLVGPQTEAYVMPYLMEHGFDTQTLHHFDNTYQAGLFIKERLIKPGDVLLLKASQNTLYFEIIVEMLLAHKEEVNELCRRESIWEAKRAEIKKAFYESLK